MSDPHDSLDHLLGSVSDGAFVDWERVLPSLPASERGEAQNLCDIDRIAAFHRQRQGAPDEAASWGPLLLLERIGIGSSAEVYRAWDPRLRREVALKLLRGETPEDAAAMLEEGRAMARVRHANVVAVHGIDTHDGRVGTWMQLVRGRRLTAIVEEMGPLPSEVASELAQQLAGALAAVHAAGVLHRDLKPDNVVRDEDGRFVLADFGLGVRSGARARGPNASGTPMYMAPELLRGEPPTQSSDVYALGATVRFALRGRHPFAVSSLAELQTVASRGMQPALETSHPNRSLAKAIDRACDPDPQRRTRSAAALLGDLRKESGERRSRPMVLLAAAIALVALLGLQLQRFVGGDARGSVDVAAQWLRHEGGAAFPLQAGDVVDPGDLLSLELSLSRPSWVYVLSEDDRGDRFLLFPQPVYDRANPLPPSRELRLPGEVGGTPSGWIVTSAGGREHFLVVVSPDPLHSLDRELAQLPAPRRGAPVEYARVDASVMEQLRGVGGIAPLEEAPLGARRSALFAEFQPLAGRETGVEGVWVRYFLLRNPG